MDTKRANGHKVYQMVIKEMKKFYSKAFRNKSKLEALV
jgi:hypothetical protein